MSSIARSDAFHVPLLLKWVLEGWAVEALCVEPDQVLIVRRAGRGFRGFDRKECGLFQRKSSPTPEEVRSVLRWVVVDDFCAVLAQPDGVLNAAAFFCRHLGVVAWATWCCSGDVRGDADVDGFAWMGLWAACGAATVGVGAAHSDTLRQRFFRVFGEVIPCRHYVADPL